MILWGARVLQLPLKKQDMQDRLRRQDAQDIFFLYLAYPAGEADPAYPVSSILTMFVVLQDKLRRVL